MKRKIREKSFSFLSFSPLSFRLGAAISRMLSPDVLASKDVSVLSGLKRVNPRDWEGKRTEITPPKPFSLLLGWVWSIFRDKHLIIWLSNLSCLTLPNKSFPIPTAKGKTNLSQGFNLPLHTTAPDLSTVCTVKLHTSWEEACEGSTTCLLWCKQLRE